ncbi:hypothetical protein [Sorangium sp. So ce1097]|uniref:hypothetical protein n=1 Tax=Sorangium sp. So ce1097 TaxID=3133330 RepID=UPI003F5DF75A
MLVKSLKFAHAPARARARPTLALSLAAALALSLAAAGAVHARPTKRACAAAYERAQGLRRDGRLLDAREALIACSQPACPPAAVADCGPWLAEVEQSLPSVVVAAKDADGRERLDVRVLVDGRLLAATLDGKALPVDPGLRTFRFEPATGQAVEERVLIREGEKNRAITVTLGAPAAGAPAARRPLASPPLATPAAAPLATPAAPLATPAEPSIPPLAWVAGGVGVAGLAVFAVAGALSLDAEADLRATCAPRCAADDVRAIRVQHAAADIGLGVGVVALGTAAWLYLTRPAAARSPQPAAARSPQPATARSPQAPAARSPQPRAARSPHPPAPRSPRAGAGALRPSLRPFIAGAAAGVEGTF